MDASIKPANSDDLLVWPDGAWCFRDDLAEMKHCSDDYVVLLDGTPEWRAKLDAETLPEDRTK